MYQIGTQTLTKPDLYTNLRLTWYTTLWRDNNHSLQFFEFDNPPAIKFAPSCPHSTSFRSGPPPLTSCPCFFDLYRGNTDGHNFVALLLVIACRLFTGNRPDDPSPSRYAKSPAFRYRLLVATGGRPGPRRPV